MRVRGSAPAPSLVDLGAGNCAKAREPVSAARAAALRRASISRSSSCATRCARCSAQHPQLDVVGARPGLLAPASTCLPSCSTAAHRLFFYPGSSIGNFTPRRGATRFLRRIRAQAPAAAASLIGVDLVKPRRCSRPPTTTPSASPRRSTSTLLRHLNRLIGSDFEPRQWRHVARFYDEAASRIEMHLEARRGAGRALAGRRAALRRGRAHPHRELVQVHGRGLRLAAARRGLSQSAGLDRRERLVRGLSRGRLSRARTRVARAPCRDARRPGACRRRRELPAVRRHVADLGLDLDRGQGRGRRDAAALLRHRPVRRSRSPASLRSCAASAPRSRRRCAPGSSFPACSSNAGTYGLLFWGMQTVASGVAGLVNLALIPVGLLGLSVLSGQEKAGWRHAVALLLGSAGLMLVCSGATPASAGGRGEWLGVAAIVAGTFCYCGCGAVVAAAAADARSRCSSRPHRRSSASSPSPP